ncbi:MAG: hypothetical protein WCC60_16140 [Ilumatobacteraceae bacterium]
MQPVPFHRLASATGLALLLALAACGSDSSSSSKVASLGTTPSAGSSTGTTVPVDSQDAMLAYAECMRENGVQMEDPTFDADGNATGGGPGRGSGIDPRSTEFQAAQKVCGDLIQGVDFGGGPGGGFDRDAIQTAMSDFTACLRDQGLTVDDITFGGPGGGAPDGSLPAGGGFPGANGGSIPSFDGGPIGTPPDGATPGGPGGAGFDPTARLIEQLGLDATDPAVTAALAACQPIIDNAFQTTTTGG